jgi:hypothetical protein
MSKLSWLYYATSLIITAIIFSLIHVFTEPIVIGSSNGISNGNPGLFPLVFFTPFFIVSIMGTYKLANRLALKTMKTMPFYSMIVLSFLFPSIVYSLTLKKAQELRVFVFEHNQLVTEIAEIPLLNTYSNSIFFTGWTFLALHFTVIWIAYVLAFLKHKG